MIDNDEKLSPLEEEFQNLCESVGDKIQKKLDAAHKLIEEAKDLSEKHGVPFYAMVSPLGQSYWPNSYAKKFKKLDNQFAYDVSGAWSEYIDAGGWEHSAVC